MTHIYSYVFLRSRANDTFILSYQSNRSMSNETNKKQETLNRINQMITNLMREKGIKITVEETSNGQFTITKYTQSKVAPFEYSRCLDKIHYKNLSKLESAVEAICFYLVI